MNITSRSISANCETESEAKRFKAATLFKLCKSFKTSIWADKVIYLNNCVEKILRSSLRWVPACWNFRLEPKRLKVLRSVAVQRLNLEVGSRG